MFLQKIAKKISNTSIQFIMEYRLRSIRPRTCPVDKKFISNSDEQYTNIRIYHSIKCHGIIYRVLVKYRSIPSGSIYGQYTSHQALFTLLPTWCYLSQQGKTRIGTCRATNDNLYHCIIGSPISKSRERKKKQLKVQLFHIPIHYAVYRYHGIFVTVYYCQAFLDTAHH